MHWYEVAAWGALGGLVQGALFLGTGLVQLSREKPRKYRWRDVIDPPADALVTLTRVIFGAVACLLVNQASPPLSIPAAIIVGFAAPALLVYIGKPLAAIAAVDKGRESRISSEAERLATIRETSPELTAQEGFHGCSRYSSGKKRGAS